MSKLKALFPLASVASLMLLAGCTSTNSAPIEDADGTLSPGELQADTSTGASDAGWQPQVQQQSMPENMQQAVATPIGETAQQATNTVQQASTTVQSNANTISTNSAVTENFTVPRNAENLPDYSKIDKGFYKGDTYKVRKGDTMFLIAYIAGMDVKELAAMNNMQEPYTLKVGQVLKVNGGSAQSASNSVSNGASSATSTAKNSVAKVTEPAVTYTQAANGTQYGSDGTVTGPVKATAGSAASAVNSAATSASNSANNAVKSGSATVQSTTKNVTSSVSNSSFKATSSNISWRWPTKGNVIQGFSSKDGGNKGIDISGSRGQAIYASAAGRVVYAGNALRGYGNLIIIKHNDDYLSAYAHNENMLVKDQQSVSAGQKIATMGSSGSNNVKLHFEIRYKGKSVDPMRYLPSR